MCSSYLYSFLRGNIENYLLENWNNETIRQPSQQKKSVLIFSEKCTLVLYERFYAFLEKYPVKSVEGISADSDV